MADPLSGPSADPAVAAEPARRVLHVVFVVDGSGSMTGERIASLNWAARAAVPAMREAAADHPGVDVLVRVLRFADSAEWGSAEPIPVGRFVWTGFEPRGETRLGAALHELAAVLRALEPARDGLLPPVIVLLSDGYPTDDADSGLAALASTALGAKAVRTAIAIGPDADLDFLRRFMGGASSKPLRANGAERLASHIRSAASEPIGELPTRGNAPASTVRSTGAVDPPPGDLVW